MIPPPPSQPPPPPSRPPPALRWDPYIIATDVAYPPSHLHQQTQRRREVLQGGRVIKSLRWDVNILYGHLDTYLERAKITNISLVVCLHPFCSSDWWSQRTRELAAEENLRPVTFLMKAITKNWQRAHILVQARRQYVDLDHMAHLGFQTHDAATAWPTIDGCTYNPQRHDGLRLGSAGDLICYRTPARGPHHGTSFCPSGNFDLVTLFRNARTDGSILIYAAWDLEIVEVIHAYVTHDH